MAPAEPCHFSFKICIVGDSGVGKTTICNRILNSKDETNGLQTLASKREVGISVKTKYVERNGTKYKICLWDCPGTSKYMQLTSRLVAGATGILLLFDVTNRSSFDNLTNWLSEIEKYTKVTKVLVGFKIDSKHARRQVEEEHAEAFASKNKMEYFEAQQGDISMCQDPFDFLLDCCVDAVPDPIDPEELIRKGIKLGPLADPGSFMRWRHKMATAGALPGITTEVDWL
eukprot:Colp12_sorted_trinity150504_noHs@14240